jgi:molecular chaperone DnaJ
MATNRDLYDVLGVERGASDAEIKRAFRKLAQQWHPDVNTDPTAPERFKEVNEAYQVLSDPQRRRAYDMFGRAGIGTPGGEGYGPFAGFQGFGDLFDAFFGGAAGGQTRRARPPSGSDLRYDLRITFEESIRGAEKEIEFNALDRCATCGGTGAEPGSQTTRCPQCGGSGEVRQVRSTMLGQMVNVTVCPTCRGEGSVVQTPCHECHGEGRVHRKRRLRVVVPPGIDEGHQMRLSAEGEAGPRGGAAGNLYVAIHVEEHEALRREGTELFYELPLSITQAALGAKVAVPTAEGDEEIEIKSGTQPGAEIRLRGRGVPHLRRPGVRGDLHVMVDVRVPSRLTRRQRELLESLSAEFGEEPAPRSGILDKVKDAIS